MRVTYMGRDNERRITGADLVAAGIESANVEDDDLVWLPGQTLEVNDDVGRFLVEEMREQFKNRDETTRDLRSKEELYAVAQQYDIPGRSTMGVDELREAVLEAEGNNLDFDPSHPGPAHDPNNSLTVSGDNMTAAEAGDQISTNEAGDDASGDDGTM